MATVTGTGDGPSGSCWNGMLVVADDGGRRHAVRLAAVTSLSDVDGTQAATLVRTSGNRSYVVGTPLDRILDALPKERPPEPEACIVEIARMRVLLGSLRLVVTRTMQALREEDLLADRVFREMREECLDATVGYGQDSDDDPLRSIICEMAVEEVTDLFSCLVPLDG